MLLSNMCLFDNNNFATPASLEEGCALLSAVLVSTAKVESVNLYDLYFIRTHNFSIGISAKHI